MSISIWGLLYLFIIAGLGCFLGISIAKMKQARGNIRAVEALETLRKKVAELHTQMPQIRELARQCPIEILQLVAKDLLYAELKVIIQMLMKNLGEAGGAEAIVEFSKECIAKLPRMTGQ